ncbi:MAG: hypothetical protein RJA57_1679 [Bacteroidota bacterium]|jgi:hypothetical protein
MSQPVQFSDPLQVMHSPSQVLSGYAEQPGNIQVGEGGIAVYLADEQTWELHVNELEFE